MRNYTHQTHVNASIENVIAFHNDPRALKILTPPGMFVQFKKIEPIKENSIADFVMWLGPLPIHWLAIHSDVGRDGFTDTQLSGPFKFWQHQHTFVVKDQTATEIIDTVNFDFSNHPFWGLVSRLMGFGLPLLFGFRGWATRNILESKKS